MGKIPLRSGLSVEKENISVITPVLTEFTCERCGFVYHKEKDHIPYLCYRCLRFLGKGVWKMSQQIEPPISRTIVGDV